MVQIAYFFIPLPEALGFEDGFVLTINRDLAPAMLAELDSMPESQLEQLRPVFEVSTSIKLWHGASTWRETDSVRQLFDVARKALPNLPGATDAGSDRTQADSTIAELFVPFGLAGETLSDAFDRALRHVQELQRAYYVITRRPVTLVTRESLPALIPYGLRSISSEEDVWPDTLSLFHLHMNVTPLHRHDHLSDGEVDRVVRAMEAQPGYRAFASFLDLWRHAHNALDLHGDYRAAAVFSAVSAEVLLDDLLSHLLWEERTRPEDAARLFSSGLSRRVRSQYHVRIGGKGWDALSDGAVRGWHKHVAGLRHRVVHGSYESSIDEARGSLDALYQLQLFVAERLSDKQVLGRYPRTALSFIGREGLEARGAWTDELTALENDHSEPHWVSTFARWKAAMQRSREDGTQSDPPAEASSNVVVVVRPGGLVSWVLHDETARMACLSAEPQLTDGQRESFASLAARDTSTPISALMIGANPTGLKRGDWVPEYRLLPLLGVMLDGGDLDPP